MADELAFIAALRQLATDPGARNFDDDCAVIEFGSETLVLTHDMMAEGIHFLSEGDPADAAWKLVATNLSDLAAKGAEPVGVLLGYMFGKDDSRFLAGLKEALEHYRVPLLGGDTISSTGPQVVGLTALGRATHRPVPARSGAQPDDHLWITGPVGAAMLGLEALRSGNLNDADSIALRRPTALLEEGRMLAPLVTAMMDVSDGLLLDATRMARASQVTIEIDSSAVPIAVPEYRRDEALRWGEDFQLLFTLPPHLAPPVTASHIGTVVTASGDAVRVDGSPLASGEKLGFEHR